MTKLEETNSIIDRAIEIEKIGLPADNIAFLADIAKSLAMIADKLCEEEATNVNERLRN